MRQGERGKIDERGREREKVMRERERDGLRNGRGDNLQTLVSPK